MTKCLLTFLALLGSAFAACTGSSPTWTSTPDRASVASCSVASGDTINISAGSATWASGIAFTKAIHIIGAGTINGSAGTTATTNLTCTNGCIAFAPSSGEETKVFEVAGIAFSGQKAIDETGWDQLPAITSLKIHNNNLDNAPSGDRAVWLSGLEWGVFYLNEFSGNYIDISVIGGVAGLPGCFNPPTLGGASYPYFEDNALGDGIGGEFVSETGQCGRMVFRHNTIAGYQSGAGAEVFDIHGEQNSGGWTTSSEYYENAVGVGTDPFRLFNHRGGQAAIFNNTATKSGGGGLAFDITEYEDHGGNGICNAYPVAYNSSESYCSPISGTCLETQVHNSFYFDNLINGSNQNPALGNPGGGSCGSSPPWGDTFYIVQNREYWLPTYGTLASIPGTCTADGNTFYGTTDTDAIYKCTSTNTWTLFYQSYTYPHPLRGGTATETMSGTSGSGVKVN